MENVIHERAERSHSLEASRRVLRTRLLGATKFMMGAAATTVGSALWATSPVFFSQAAGTALLFFGMPLMTQGANEMVSGKKHTYFQQKKK